MGLFSAIGAALEGFERSLEGPGEFSEWWAEGEGGGEELVQEGVNYGFTAVANFVAPVVGGLAVQAYDEGNTEGYQLQQETPMWDDYDFTDYDFSDLGEVGYGGEPMGGFPTPNGDGYPVWGGGNGAMIPVMGTIRGLLGESAPAAVVRGGTAGALVGGARTLASLFAGAGRSAAFLINGVRGTLPQLWKYTRRHGAAVVANALGITVGALGAMLLSAPDAGRTRRRRGISSRDISTTKRVVRFTNQMARQIGCVSRPRARYRRSGGRHTH